MLNRCLWWYFRPLYSLNREQRDVEFVFVTLSYYSFHLPWTSFTKFTLRKPIYKFPGEYFLNVNKQLEYKSSACIFVLRISVLHLSIIFLFDFGTDTTVLYFFFILYSIIRGTFPRMWHVYKVKCKPVDVELLTV
jgi:hypothetical protein